MIHSIETHLQTVLLPFWKNVYDKDHGGFYGHVDFDLVLNKHAYKGIVQQARHLYAFSRLYKTYHQADLRPIIDGTYRLIVDKFRDPVLGTYAWMADYVGNPIDRRIVTYGQSFVIYGLSEYAIATGDPIAYEHAMTLYRHLENRHYNPKTGGYEEEFSCAMIKLPPTLLADNVKDCAYSANTHLHLLEAYTNLYRAGKDLSVKKSLRRLVKIMKESHYDSKTHSVVLYLNESFRPIPAGVSYGHDIETAWLIDDAARLLGMKSEDYRPLCDALSEQVYQNGFNGRYVIYENRGNPDLNEVWWVQCEAMTGFLVQYQRSGDPKYLEAVQTIYATIQKDLVDKRPNSEWFWSVGPDGTPERLRGIAERWKTTYHNVRALLEVVERYPR